MNARQVIKLLESRGWVVASKKGSHVKLTHPLQKYHIIVPMHGSKDLKAGLLHAILRDAGLK